MKKLLLFLTLTCAAVAQVSIDIGDIAWPVSSANQVFRRNAANNAYEFVTLSPVITLGTDATGSLTMTNLTGGTLNLTLANSGVSAGTYGGSSQPFTFIFDAKGRATSVTANNQAANTFFAGPGSGSAAAPAFRALVQADTQASTAANRNALAPRGGVVVDGTASTRVVATLTNQNIAADPVSVVIGFRAPSSAPASTFDIFGTSSSSTDHNQANALFCNIGNTGDLRVILKGATTNDSRSATVAGFVTTYSGKPVTLAAVRNGATMAVYINGSAVSFTETTAGNAPAWSTSLTTTYFGIGYRDSSAVAAGAIFYSASFYNLALSAADVQEIYELGGAVPSRYQFGSQSEKNTDGGFEVAGGGGADAFLQWIEGIAGASTVTRDTVDFYSGAASCKWVLDGSNSSAQISQSVGAFLVTKRYRLRYAAKASLASSGIISSDYIIDATTSSTLNPTLTTSWAVYEHTVYCVSTSPNSFNFKRGGATAGQTVWLDAVSLVQVGAVVHLPLTDQLGLQARDASTNGLHAERTSTGTFWTDPRQTGRQTLTYTFAHSAISSTAATTVAFVLPPNTVLREVQLNRTAAFDASTTLDIGISGTPTKFVTATNVVPTGFAQVTSSSLVPESATANTTVYVKKNQATTTGSVTMNFIIEAVGSPTQP